jgi:DNA-directed RNA polymerase specialized sigma24 family protein
MDPAEYETNAEEHRKKLRRVVIENRQRKTLEQVRDSLGYAPDLDPNAYDQRTFRLINQRMQLDRLPHADYVVPRLDDWKHWTAMGDWESRNRILEELTGKLRRREASTGEVTFLVTVCRPAWAAVAANLRTYGGVDVDPGAEGIHAREEARRVNELDRAELDQVIQHALMDALLACPRPFPRRFFPWRKATLSYRALDHVREDLGEHDTQLPHDDGIKDVVDSLLSDPSHPAASFYASPASPAHSQWLRTLDMDRVFEVAEEYATYNRSRTACERAVDRLPTRQGQVVRDHYFRAMTQERIAEVRGIAASTVRNSHSKALGNLYRDDELFEVLAAVGKVRDKARREQLAAERQQAA